MERAALDEAQGAMVDGINRYSFPDDLSEYLNDSQTHRISSESVAFIVDSPKELPPMPIGERDLLIIVSGGKKKFDESNARRVHNFPKLKAYDDKNEVINWIQKEGSVHNIDLSRVATALFVNCGNSLRKISSEIRKLAVITPPGAITTPEDARSLICFSSELSPRNVIDAICDGHSVRALAYYDKLQEGGDETGWIIAYLHRHVLQQLRMEHLVQSGTSDARGSELLGMHPFLYRKMRETRIGLWSQASLVAGINTLADLDISHKRGDIFARFGLELEIVRLSQEASNVKRNRH